MLEVYVKTDMRPVSGLNADLDLFVWHHACSLCFAIERTLELLIAT